jgi:hypothetical protein
MTDRKKELLPITVIHDVLFLTIAHMLPYGLVVVSVGVIHDVHGLHKQKLQRDHKATCVQW